MKTLQSVVGPLLAGPGFDHTCMYFILRVQTIINIILSYLSLKRHKESVHDGVRYSCDSSEYKATTLSHLKTHKEVIHDGVRYSCDSCDYRATALNSLKTHRESIHDGVRYSCDGCDYKATQLNDLKRHK